MVFTCLVRKGLLRMGTELTCPTCALPKESNICELCGSPYDTTRQLVDETFHYRRTDVLGLEKNSEGAIPVGRAPTMDINLGGIPHRAMNVDNLRRIADTLPAHRLETFILFAKLSHRSLQTRLRSLRH
jgi:hypothetical protein